MLLSVLVLQLVLWISSANAFFVWKPCAVDSSCVEVKKASVRPTIAGQNATQPGTIKFDLVQRAHPPLPRAQAAVRGFGRYLRRKAIPLLPRTNQYKVVEAQTPTTPHTLGINQDGNDYAYFIRAYVGAAKTPLYLLFDTGAGTTWVMGSGCASEACQLHDSFSPSKSSTFESTPHNYSIAYGSGTVQGKTGRDTLRLGDISVTMEFGIADQTSDDFKHFPFDGIAGMSMSVGSTDNLAQQLKSSGQLSAGVFSVYLNRNSAGTNNGELMLGGINSNKYKGDITYTTVAVPGRGDWSIPMDGVSFDGKDAGVKGRPAYIDTGTSYIFGPATDVESFHKLVSGATKMSDGVTWKVPCDTTKTLSFSFSGKSFDVLPQDWVSAPDPSDGTCTSNIYGHEVVAGSWLLGAVFLKNVYAIFDMDNTKIGFALRNEAVPVVTSAAPSTITPPPPSDTQTNAPSLGLGGHETSSTTPGSVQQQGEPTPAPSVAGASRMGCIVLNMAMVSVVTSFWLW